MTTGGVESYRGGTATAATEIRRRFDRECKRARDAALRQKKEWDKMTIAQQAQALRVQINVRMNFATPAQRITFSKRIHDASSIPDLEKILADLKAEKGW